MRIVAGTARGITIAAPPGRSTRPTSDRVREAVFNSLNSLAMVDDAEVVDLFAGSGALGLEALSRGARHVTFVESDRAALEVIAANIERCRFGDRCRVVATTVERFLSAGQASTPYDLALIDPPYAYGEWSHVFATLNARVAVVESDRQIELDNRWNAVRQRKYGGTVVQIAIRSDDPVDATPEEYEQ